MKPIFTFLFLLSFYSLFAQTDSVSDKSKNTASPVWYAHFQFTAISQSHASFKALYSGTNSLNNGVERGFLTITSTAFIGRKLWHYANVYVNPEISGGQGLSSTRGIAGFTNGESFRVGNPQPTLYMARYYLQQYIPLSKKGYDTIEDNANHVNEIIPSSRITLTAGKFCLSDFFDDNIYSHDPRSQFMNWALMSNGAWDYPANTRGYTLGIVAELITPGFAVKASIVQVPTLANGPWLNKNIGAVNGTVIEFDKRFTIGSKEGKIRLLGFRNLVNAPSYSQTVEEMKRGDSSALGIFNGTAYNAKYHSVKYGAGFNGELKFSDNFGCFLRAGYNDGKTATWAYTEIDQTVTAGIQISGNLWKRNDDMIGIAGIVDGISKGHQAFLKAGGYGFIIGDGYLTYGSETIGEIYYNAKLFSHCYLSADYQFVKNPAYNKDRGPVNVFALRGHVEF